MSNSAMTTLKSDVLWAIVNTNSGSVRKTCETRKLAREERRPNERVVRFVADLSIRA